MEQMTAIIIILLRIIGDIIEEFQPALGALILVLLVVLFKICFQYLT
ncbi:hypothetical protein [Aneurinibacillus aneurinilyticus]|uniref:Uncharacterized protein n=1 Tax=Aneurinibacillus aneurinilyticus TaxID=1391 RepID=A0A848D0S2_ANEAE|nr:hypothetical protein [Aneurinibacillus aneurinilyticus]NMF01009.1 hypothetical protein [Aneurinibacillus aneurinilyticus]